MLSPHRRWIVAAGSGHNIQFDRPDLVVAAVRDILRASESRR